MKETVLHKIGLTGIFIFCALSALSQTSKSEWSTIHINNQPASIDSVPPTIHLISPHVKPGEIFVTDQKYFTLIGEIKDESGLPDLLINSKEVIPNTNGIFREKVLLNSGENIFKLVAIDENKNLTEKSITIQHKPIENYTETLDIKGDYHALLIAVEQYNHPNIYDLENPVEDAKALKKILSSRYYFKDGNITFLENPTRDEIINTLDDYSRQLTEEDNLLIFFAGHGIWDEEAKTGYWLPTNADKIKKVRWVRNSTVQDYLKEIRTKHTLLVTDACFSGGILKTRGFKTKTTLAIKKLYELPSRKAMTSGNLSEVPDESVFVRYFIDRLANNQKRFISTEELFSSFRIAVINNSDVLPQYGVIKNVGDEGGDFIFILDNKVNK